MLIKSRFELKRSSPCLERPYLEACTSANHSCQTVLQAWLCWGSYFQNLIASHLKRSANVPLRSVTTSCSITEFYQNNLSFLNYTVEQKGTQITQYKQLCLAAPRGQLLEEKRPTSKNEWCPQSPAQLQVSYLSTAFKSALSPHSFLRTPTWSLKTRSVSWFISSSHYWLPLLKYT